MKKISILVDEQSNDINKYIVCDNERGKYAVIARGTISSPEQLQDLQLSYDNANVQIDCAWRNTKLQHYAQVFGWQLMKYKPNEFPFIEAMVQIL